MIPFRNVYAYRQMDRETHPDGKRHYIDPDNGQHLPSVTTIIDATSDKSFLIEWVKRVGEKKAEEIKKYATDLGTLMHTHLEHYVEGKERPRGTNMIRQQAANMADVVIEKGLCNVEEVYGMEVALHFPGLYAGTTDLVGVHKGEAAILDYKTAKVIRKREQIEGYLCQLSAYALAHNEVFGTKITKGVVLMVDRGMNYAEFIIEGDEMAHYQREWISRMDRFYGVVEAAAVPVPA